MSNISKIKISGTSYNIKDENACKVVELTQAQYDDLPTSAKTSNSLFVITDATAGDLSNYYTKTETDNAITAATSTKQDTLVSGTNIKTINGETLLGEGNITIQGGGDVTVDQSLDSGSTNPVANSAITNAINEKQNKLTASNGIKINQYTNTITLDVPIYKAKDFRSCFVGQDYNYPNIVSGQYSFAVGLNNNVTGNYSLAVGGLDSYGEGNSATTINTFAFGRGNIAKSFCSTVVGYHNSSSNEYETDFGIYNNSFSASTTWGNSGNTLFSVGNGTADNARHNAFEIRQNGDIYITKDGQDVKLQDQLGGGGGGSSYTAGDGIDITNDVISVTGKVDTSAIITSVTSSSTDSQVPSAKAVYDIVGNIETLLSKI